MTQALEELERPLLACGDTDDPARHAHYVEKAVLTDAMVFGEELEALCGYRWIPSRNPDGLPVCPVCQAIWENLPE